MITIGVDGCKSGWVAAVNDASRDLQIEVFSELKELWEKYQSSCSLLLIDMPIGLVETGPEGRACDRLARRMLSPRRHSSIFTPPCRAALYVPEEQASEINYEHTRKKLSRQTINIMPKMREVDRWMRRLSVPVRQKIRESHPEVIFTAMNGGSPLIHNKKQPEGQEERLAILERYHPAIRPVLQKAQADILRKVALTDDLIDALVLGIAAKVAREQPQKSSSLPEIPPLDGEGLPMEIFYVMVAI